ncbi:hypothetical protein O988_03981 [Pseudogymnoascus sp. VKM F-3808]|nr:hypothetical protein O988_03981 [Pseudogymnoascus sp. VKM F-3808]
MSTRPPSRQIYIQSRLCDISSGNLSPTTAPTHSYSQPLVMSSGCNAGIIPNGDNTCPYGVQPGSLTADPVYNESNCACAQTGECFTNGHICAPTAPLCVHNLQQHQQTMLVTNENNSQYPISWASSGTDATVINIDEGCNDINYVYNNGPNNKYLQMVPQDGLNEAPNLLRASQAQDALRLPIAIQRMISEMEQEFRPIFDEYQEYNSGDLLPMGFETSGGTFIAVGPNHIIPPSDSQRATRYPSTRGESSVVSGPGTGSGSGSGLWNRGEFYFDHIGAQYEYAGYDYDDAEEA